MNKPSNGFSISLSATWEQFTSSQKKAGMKPKKESNSLMSTVIIWLPQTPTPINQSGIATSDSTWIMNVKLFTGNSFIFVYLWHWQSDPIKTFYTKNSYELQIEPNARKCGLGKFMMDFLETMALHLKLEKVVLTCSKLNIIGQSFFREKMK